MVNQCRPGGRRKRLLLRQIILSLGLLLVLLLCAPTVMAQRWSSDTQRTLDAIVALRDEGRYAEAIRQARAAARTARELGDSLYLATAYRYHSETILANPRRTTRQRTEAIRLLRESTRIYQQLNENRLARENITLLNRITNNQLAPTIPTTPGAPPGYEVRPPSKTLRERLDSLELESETLAAVVATQNATISELTERQVRQLLLLSDQERRLDSLAIVGLEDSLLLTQQQIILRQQESELVQERQQRNILVLVALVVALALLVIYTRYVAIRRYQQQLEEKNVIIASEQRRSDELLRNILPAMIAAELKREGKAVARTYESVTVLFADFRGFSQLASRLPAADLIKYLDEAFRSFDAIVDELGLEKIKTIGDAYMCAAGLPEVQSDHAERAVRAALRMQHYLATNPHFEARIGLHSGPVVAGVVGSRKFAYDIWGDTVNMAARLEAASEVGRVNISRATRELLPANRYRFIPRGRVPVKNIGDVEMFFVEAEEMIAVADAPTTLD